MSERKADFFGTFLENLKQPASPNLGSTHQVSHSFSPNLAAAEPGVDPLNDVLKALRQGGRSAKELIPLVGRSVSQFLAVSDKLVELGWVRRMDGDVLQLTDEGREIADLLG